MSDFAAFTRDLTTEEYANAVGVKPDTVRRGYCVDGNYLGVVPKKLPNRLLRWPVDKVKDVLGGGR